MSHCLKLVNKLGLAERLFSGVTHLPHTWPQTQHTRGGPMSKSNWRCFAAASNILYSYPPHSSEPSGSSFTVVTGWYWKAVACREEGTELDQAGWRN